jgi:two-component sensor histidine kinase
MAVPAGPVTRLKNAFFRFFLAPYENADYVTMQKARVLLSIYLTILFFVVPLLLVSLTLHTVSYRALIVPGAMGPLLLVIIVLFRKGHFALSAHIFFIISFAGVWTAIFSGNYSGHPVERTDTFVLILALLVLTPLVVRRRRIAIPAYFFANGALFLVFLNKIHLYLSIPELTVVEYFIDNAIALSFIGFICYKVFTINTTALEKASDEIAYSRRAEEELLSSLREKETLLKEVHHRVKNNFQVVISLLHLQSHQISDASSREMFMDCESRIRSMALVHEKLYRSKNLALIDFSEYLKDLAGEIRRLYDRNTPPVSLRVHTEPLLLDISHAIPCGLIISELLSNAYKHAFPPEHQGEREIRVSLKRNPNNSIECAVRDTGVGLPAGMELHSAKSLGFSLVRMLAEDQLRGSLSVHGENGTAVSVNFGMKE